MKNKMPKVGTKEFNELASAYFGGKPKQETLLGKTISKKDADKDSFEDVTKYKIERSYSEEDMLKSFMAGIKCESNNGKNFEQWFEKFKNK